MTMGIVITDDSCDDICCKMVKDIFGQEIKDGDFVVSASKSSGEMVMGVMKNVKQQTRVRVDQSRWGADAGKWKPANKSARMYTLGRTLKLQDEMILEANPELFEVMNNVRENLGLKTNRNLQSAATLRKMLETLK